MKISYLSSNPSPQLRALISYLNRSPAFQAQIFFLRLRKSLAVRVIYPCSCVAGLSQRYAVLPTIVPDSPPISMLKADTSNSQIKIIGELEPYQLVEHVLPDIVRSIIPPTSLDISVSGISRRCLDRLAESLPCLENLTVYDSIGVLPEVCDGGIDDQEDDLSLTDWTSYKLLFVTSENLAQAFLPLSRLRHLRRFNFSTTSSLEECEIRCVFHWRDALASLHTLILQDKMLVRDLSNREWRLKSLDFEDAAYQGLRE